MGLTINDKKIDRISGPIGFTLLKPLKSKFDYFKETYNIRLPLMMLFGDEHFSKEFQCNSCNCSIHTKGCCLEIGSNEFLQTIDSLASKDHPIDFAIESFWAGTQRQSIQQEYVQKHLQQDAQGKNEPMLMLRENIAICYVKEQRGKAMYQKYCPTKNIRWQYTDARQTQDSKYNLESLIDKINDATNLGSIDSKTKLNEVIDSLKVKYGNAFYKILEYQLLLVKGDTNAVDYFFELSQMVPSIITKQLRKLPNELANIDSWVDIMKKYQEYVYRENMSEINLITEKIALFYKLILDNKLEELGDKIDNDELFRSIIKLSVGIFIQLNSIFLDLYYFLRTIKIPQGDVNPFLSLSYFGDSHRKHLVHFLTNITGLYEIEVNVENDSKSESYRCMDIPEIDLNNLALEYGVDIRENSLLYNKQPEKSPAKRSQPNKKSQPEKQQPKISPAKRSPPKKSPPKRSQPKKKSHPKRSPAKRSQPKKKSQPKRSQPKKKSHPKRSPAKRSQPKKKSQPKRSPAKKKSQPKRSQPKKKSVAKKVNKGKKSYKR